MDFVSENGGGSRSITPNPSLEIPSTRSKVYILYVQYLRYFQKVNTSLCLANGFKRL